MLDSKHGTQVRMPIEAWNFKFVRTIYNLNKHNMEMKNLLNHPLVMNGLSPREIRSKSLVLEVSARRSVLK